MILGVPGVFAWIASDPVPIQAEPETVVAISNVRHWELVINGSFCILRTANCRPI